MWKTAAGKKVTTTLFSEILLVPWATPDRQQDLQEINKWPKNWCKECFGFLENWAEFAFGYQLYKQRWLAPKWRGRNSVGGEGVQKVAGTFKLGCWESMRGTPCSEQESICADVGRAGGGRGLKPHDREPNVSRTKARIFLNLTVNLEREIII